MATMPFATFLVPVAAPAGALAAGVVAGGGGRDRGYV